MAVHQYERINRLTQSALELLNTIWLYGADRKFNSTIDQLVAQLTQLPHLSEHSDKLSTYRTIFSIDIDRDLQSGVIAQMMHSHILDAWRLVLTQIQVGSLQYLNKHLVEQSKQRGQCIQRYQRIISRKNSALHRQQGIIKVLGDRLRSKEQPIALPDPPVSIEHGYEIVLPRPFSMIGQWFMP